MPALSFFNVKAAPQTLVGVPPGSENWGDVVFEENESDSDSDVELARAAGCDGLKPLRPLHVDKATLAASTAGSDASTVRGAANALASLGSVEVLWAALLSHPTSAVHVAPVSVPEMGSPSQWRRSSSSALLPRIASRPLVSRPPGRAGPRRLPRRRRERKRPTRPASPPAPAPLAARGAQPCCQCLSRLLTSRRATRRAQACCRPRSRSNGLLSSTTTTARILTMMMMRRDAASSR